MESRNRGFHSRKLLGLCALSILCLVLLSPVQSTAQVEHNDLTGVKVAVYSGGGVMSSSHTALTKMFEWMNASVSTITASLILAGSLDGYDILVIPGGSETVCSSELGQEGKQKVKDFVAQGGSYFGICGGATFGVTYLRLFNGFISPVNEPGSIIHMTTMHVNQSSTGPNLSDLSENFTTMYYGSQYLTPQWGVAVHIIATYDYNDKAGMVAFEYGNGTVFLSSPHPEYEENSDRDDTTFGANLIDPDSEWPLLFRVSKWLIEASPEAPKDLTTTTPTNIATPLDIPSIAIVSTGILMVILVVSVIYRRPHI